MPASGSIVRAGRYIAIGYNFSGIIIAGAAVGWLIDRWLGTGPWGLLVFSLIGIAGSFIWLIDALRRFERSDRDARP